jgi:hypothetical protein
MEGLSSTMSTDLGKIPPQTVAGGGFDAKRGAKVCPSFEIKKVRLLVTRL